MRSERLVLSLYCGPWMVGLFGEWKSRFKDILLQAMRLPDNEFVVYSYHREQVRPEFMWPECTGMPRLLDYHVEMMRMMECRITAVVQLDGRGIGGILYKLCGAKGTRHIQGSILRLNRKDNC